MNIQRTFTPDDIQELKENQIFVFGSNMNGNHAGGAAKLAVEKFGAIEGQSAGVQGQSYAIPTLDKAMQKLPIEEISKSIDELYAFADDNADLDFYVTKIGTGIAGFSVEEIASVFKEKEFTPFNVILPMEFSLIRGVKGFEKNMRCRDFQFEENKEYKHEGSISCCNSGFHYCENPLQTFHYYKATNSIFYEVEGYGKIDTEDKDSKVAVSDLTIKAKIELPNLIKFGIEFTAKKIDFFRRRAQKLIDKNTNSSSVNSGGNSSVNSGKDSSVNSGGYSSVNSGGYSSVNSGGNYSVNSGGNYSVCAGLHFSEIKLEGKNSFGIAGKKSKIRGKKGCAICLVEFDNDNNIIGVKSALIDGKKLKEDVFYTLENGKFVEVKDKI